MQTVCPECTSTMSLPKPDTDPGTFARCDDCGDRVQPGAFLCPHCRTGLQVERSLLPGDGGHGRCPECSEAVWVPPLVCNMEQTSTATPEDLGAADIAPIMEETEGESDATVHALEDLEDDVQDSEEQGSCIEPSMNTSTSFAASAADHEAPRGRRGLGFFLGALVGAGAAAGVIMNGFWVAPQLPWDAEFLFANLITWAGFFGLGGGLLGFLLGGARRS